MGVVSVSIAGSPLPVSMSSALSRAEVDQALNLPSTCAVEIGSVDYARTNWQGIDFAVAHIGASFAVGIGDQNAEAIFEGELGALDATFGEPCIVEFQGYDALYGLQFGTKTRTFEKSTDAQIAARIAKEHGLAIEVDDNGVTYPYVIQADQSDFAFLSSRAARIHFEMFATGRKLFFRRSRAGKASLMTLIWEEQISHFSVRVKALKQGSRVQRVGWDPKKKKLVVGDVSSGPAALRMGGKKTGYQTSTAFAASPVSAMDPEIVDQKTARAVAAAAYEADLEGFIEAKGSMKGNTKIKPGINIKLDGIGSRLSGIYYVTAAKHIYTQEDGYTTDFTLQRTGV